MVNDSVREELALKISPLGKSAKIEIKEKPVAAEPIIAGQPIVSNQPVVAPNQPVLSSQQQPPQPKPSSSKPVLTIANTKPPQQHTGEIMAKATSPTLVEFQNKNAVLPEWRLQLQNAVRMRQERAPAALMETAQTVAPRAALVVQGATALKSEPIEQPAPVLSDNPKLNAALQRIEASRQKYYAAEEKPKQNHLSVVQNQTKSFPYMVSNKPAQSAAIKSDVHISANFTAKPKPAAVSIESKIEKFDTNKLPPLSTKISSSFERRAIEIAPVEPKIKDEESRRLEISAIEPAALEVDEQAAGGEFEVEGIDDRAPFSRRFSAGFFDLIVGSLVSGILLAPFMLANGNLFTMQGLFAFLATCSIVMFIYMTTTIGTIGRTFGMRLFSLEIVDIEENAYPTFHQAAVSSSVYLVSLALGGIGFLTLFLNDEKRAAHDLLSGTIVVKEEC